MSLAAALEFAVRTDPGIVRDANEDSIFVSPHQGLAILAGGMGGHHAGDVASGMATTLLATGIDVALRANSARPMNSLPLRRRRRAFARRCLRSHVEAANAAIFAAGRSQSHSAQMETTLLATLFHDDRVAVAHVGDSRRYRRRGTRFSLLTRDHSRGNEQVDKGDLGVDTVGEIDSCEQRVALGDHSLLCSNGLNAMFDDKEICITLPASEGDLEAAAARLIEMASDRGGCDKVPLTLVRVRSRFPAVRGRWLAFATWLRQDNGAE